MAQGIERTNAVAAAGENLQKGESVVRLVGGALPTRPDLGESSNPLEAKTDMGTLPGPATCFEKRHRWLNVASFWIGDSRDEGPPAPSWRPPRAQPRGHDGPRRL